MLRRSMLALCLLGCTDSKDDDTDTDVVDTVDTTEQISTCADEASVGLTVTSGELEGEVELSLVLAHPEDTRADLRLTYSLDGDSFDEMTVTPALDDLAASSGGVSTTLTWDTVADLGYGRFEDIIVKAVASSENCNPWPPVEMDSITVDNVEVPPPMCAAMLTDVVGPVDGPVTVGFELTREELANATVELSYSTDGVEFTEATLSAVDCDGDEIPDGPTSLEVTEATSSWCLTWDSQVDLVSDEEITLQLSCYVEGTAEAVAVGTPFMLENDPTPGPGEVVITEMMLLSVSQSGRYIELKNTSNHTLDLEGMLVEMWRSSTPLTDPPFRQFTVDLATDTLPVEPGGLVLFGESDDPVAAGCRDPDVVWPTSFVLIGDSILKWSADGTEIGLLDYTDGEAWLFDYGVALGCDPAHHASGCTDAAQWCPQFEAINGCAELLNPGENGTPGLENATCPVP